MDPSERRSRECDKKEVCAQFLVGAWRRQTACMNSSEMRSRECDRRGACDQILAQRWEFQSVWRSCVTSKDHGQWEKKVLYIRAL